MVSLAEIKEAQARIRGIASRTCLIEFKHPESDTRKLFLKPENQQPIGAFKLRGAYNKIASLSEKDRRRGVITYSSGNHAQGVAYAARALGVKAVIVMPENAPAIKRKATAALGAEIIFVGSSSSDTLIAGTGNDSEAVAPRPFLRTICGAMMARSTLVEPQTGQFISLRFS